MARLGEHLAAARLLEQDQIERALRAQVLWGGRLGTNLIELGLLDLDGISRALGRQQHVPAALARHFEKADRELQERLPVELAKQWSVVPLLHVGPDKKIAVAVIDRLPPDAIAELAEAFLCAPDGIVQSVAAEMRVRYHLERVYGLPRDARFLRLKGPNVTPFPQFDNVPVPVDTESDVAVPIVVDDSAHPTGRAPRPGDRTARIDDTGATDEDAVVATQPATPPQEVDDLARLIDDAIAQATAIEPTEAVVAGRDRRSYVRTLADSPPTPSPASLVSATASPALARMAIKKVARPTPAGITGPTPAGITATPAGTSRPAPARLAPARTAPPHSPQTFVEATRAIRRAPNRDRVAELVIDTLDRFVASCDGALLLVIRGELAVSWKQFSRSCETSAEVAVPLDKPGLVPAVIANNAIARCGAAELTAIDEALMRSLGELKGDLVVVPIAIADKVMAVIATATKPDAAVESIELVAVAAAAAFARLIRDASR